MTTDSVAGAPAMPPAGIDRLRGQVARIRSRVRASTVESGEALPVALTLMLPGVPLALGFIAYSSFVVSRHAEGYVAGGVAQDEAYAGAVVAQILVAMGLAAVAVLFRRGWSARHVLVAVGATTVLALGFVLLPNLVAGHSWLTILLATMTTLLFDVFVGVIVGTVVLLPNW